MRAGPRTACSIGEHPTGALVQTSSLQRSIQARRRFIHFFFLNLDIDSYKRDRVLALAAAAESPAPEPAPKSAAAMCSSNGGIPGGWPHRGGVLRLQLAGARAAHEGGDAEQAASGRGGHDPERGGRIDLGRPPAPPTARGDGGPLDARAGDRVRAGVDDVGAVLAPPPGGRRAVRSPRARAPLDARGRRGRERGASSLARWGRARATWRWRTGCAHLAGAQW